MEAVDPDSPPIRLDGCRRSFGARTALDGVDLVVRRGTISGLVGPNGSGKTTLLRIVAGFLRPDTGTARVLGVDPFRKRETVMERARFAFAPPALFDSLTAREHLTGLARLSGSRARRTDVEQALERVDLAGRADERVRGFSFGMRQRLALAQALVPEPELLVLDEPTDGLDPLAVLELRDVLRRLRDERGVTVLLSSHLMVEVDRLVDDLLVLREGRAVFQGPPAELRRGRERLVVTVDDPERAAQALRARGLEARTGPDGALELSADGDASALDLESARALLGGAGVQLVGFHREVPSLEEALLAELRRERD